MDLMSRKLKILSLEKERIKRAISSDKLWRSTKSRTDSNFNSEIITSKGNNIKKKTVNQDSKKENNEPQTQIVDASQYQQIVEPKYTEDKIELPKPEPIPENNSNEEVDDVEEVEEYNDIQPYADIKTTSSMRSKLKGLETKERVKLLMKRSMSSDKLSKARKDMANQALNDALEIN